MRILYPDDVYRNLIVVAHTNAMIRQRRGVVRPERKVSPELARQIELRRATWNREEQSA